ncbi:MAG: hypothetical protein ACRC14_03710 [Paracoccaceae bacterium]
MESIVEAAESVKAMGLKWTALLTRHSVAVYHCAEDRNQVSGMIFEAKKAVDKALDDLCAVAHEVEESLLRKHAKLDCKLANQGELPLLSQAESA